MKQSEKNKLRTLNIFMRDCSCYSCGPGKEEVIQKEHAGLDPITKEPTYEYNKYEWHTPCEDLNYENVAQTLEGTIVVNNGDYEETTIEEYEEYLSYWHNKISEDYIVKRENRIDRSMRSVQ